MLTRIISGVVGIGLFLVCCFAGEVPFAFSVAIIAAIGAAEFAAAQKRANPPDDVPQSMRGAAAFMRPINAFLPGCGVATILAACYLPQFETVYLTVLTLGVACGLVFVIKAWRSGTLLGWFRAFYGKVGFWYIAMFGSFIFIREAPGRMLEGHLESDRGAWMMLFIASCVWAADTFAFFTGKAIGKHKLAPRLSPAKTIEGFFGGLVGSIVVGALFGHWIYLPWTTGVIIGTIAGVLGPMGDLFESGMKRELGIKDFGAIMPGHGGILDQFDSLLFVAPVVSLYLLLSHFLSAPTL